jgi:hypothetical protein
MSKLLVLEHSLIAGMALGVESVSTYAHRMTG